MRFGASRRWDDSRHPQPNEPSVSGGRSSGVRNGAHARSGDRIAIGAYLGASDVFDRSISEFAEAYADQNERDFQALKDAAASGRVVAKTGI
jgi:hypothetical protein